MPSRQTWDDRCRRLHDVLLEGMYTTKDYARDIGEPVAKVYSKYSAWRRMNGIAKVPRLRRA